MQIQVKKTDARFVGSNRFKYYIKIKPRHDESATEEFFKLRVWCWETWGPSREVNSRVANDYIVNKYTDDSNEHWSWLNDEYRARLYLKDKNEVALFQLKWGI